MQSNGGENYLQDLKIQFLSMMNEKETHAVCDFQNDPGTNTSQLFEFLKFQHFFGIYMDIRMYFYCMNYLSLMFFCMQAMVTTGGINSAHVYRLLSLIYNFCSTSFKKALFFAGSKYIRNVDVFSMKK